MVHVDEEQGNNSVCTSYTKTLPEYHDAGPSDVSDCMYCGMPSGFVCKITKTDYPLADE